jgi:hypothetical protein
VLGAVLLAMSALKDQAAYFYAPGDVARATGLPLDRRSGSAAWSRPARFAIARRSDDRFHRRRRDPAHHPGPLPRHPADLFREDSGVVAEGRFRPDGLFVADEILAKHDENYMPPELAGDKHKSGDAEMIAEAGLAALWLAAALSLLQLGFGIAAALPPCGEAGREGDHAQGGWGRGLRPRPSPSRGRRRRRPLAVAQAVLVAIAFFALIQLFLRTDLSVALVAANSHSMKPWLYKFAGAWGNHEGSMLLWVTVLGIAGAAVALFERRLPERTLIATLAAQAAIGLGFYAFLLFASNPFERLVPAPLEGQGLNPLLQDPGLAFHPPTLYFGYVGISIAFSFAVGALVTRDVGPAFARAMRPWVLGAWIFLTLGITAGSYWAYYELGWGGWWFWDPVENASLMPWLAATACSIR